MKFAAAIKRFICRRPRLPPPPPLRCPPPNPPDPRPELKLPPAIVAVAVRVITVIIVITVTVCIGYSNCYRFGGYWNSNCPNWNYMCGDRCCLRYILSG